MEEIKNLLLDQGRAFEEFRKAQDNRFKVIEEELEVQAKQRVRDHFAPAGSRSSFEGSAEQKAAADFLRRGVPAAERKGMATDDVTKGGYLVPDLLANKITSIMTAASPIRALANVVKAEGSNLQIPVMTALPAASWSGERSTRSETAAPVFGQVAVPDGDLYALVEMTQRIVDDAAFDVINFVAGAVATQFASSESQAFVSGSGLDQPQGFLTFPQGRTPVTTSDSTREFGVVQYTASGQAGAFASTNPIDALVTLFHSLSAPYRVGAAWLMSSDALRLVRQFRDSAGQPIWQPSEQAGVPSTLFGAPVHEAPHLPAVAANSYSIAVANWQAAYAITDIRDTRMVFDQVTKPGFVRLHFWRRTGGALVDSSALKLMKFSSS